MCRLAACHKPIKKVLFLNLKAFSVTGGIEKFNRAFLKALSDLEKEGKVVADAWSMYDETCNDKYFNPGHYKCFSGKKVRFILKVWLSARQYDTVILAHINLSLAGWGIKKMFPHKQIILVAHGIEVWSPLKGVKKALIHMADKILSVSNFTKKKIIEVHRIDEAKTYVFHNTIDPYFTLPLTFEKPQYLRDRYGIKEGDPVIFTLTRLSYTEKYKGYDKVMQIMPFLKRNFPNVRYILSGQPDIKEKQRLMNLKETHRIKDEVLLTGFVKDEEVADHYLLADVFILPSQKEGFGIVFIEAMACGIPVVAGNRDGSVDALQQGELGYLIDPDNEMEILGVLENILAVKDKIAGNSIKKELQQKVDKAFGFETFKQNLKKVLA